jgi:hypothetical protein
MAKGKMDLSTFVGKLLEEQDGDVLREGIRGLSQALMESEAAGLIGADRYERTSDDRQTSRCTMPFAGLARGRLSRTFGSTTCGTRSRRTSSWRAETS